MQGEREVFRLHTEQFFSCMRQPHTTGPKLFDRVCKAHKQAGQLCIQCAGWPSQRQIGYRCGVAQAKKETALWQTGEGGFLFYNQYYRKETGGKESGKCRYFCKENG